MILLNGNVVAKEKLEILKNKVKKISFDIKLTIIQIGDLFESNRYISHKIEKANQIGIKTNHIKLSEHIDTFQLVEIIKKENNNCHGLIVQLPLPKHIDEQKVLDAVDEKKDIDGLSTTNKNNFYNNNGFYFIPATARAILMLLNYYKINFNDKKIVILGESNLVGKPIKHLLTKTNHNVISKNKNTGIFGSEEADILIVAIGIPNYIKSENVKKGAIVIDVGINRNENNQIIGDVDFEDVKNKVSFISPSPGGVGPLTVVSLLENLIDSVN